MGDLFNWLHQLGGLADGFAWWVLPYTDEIAIGLLMLWVATLGYKVGRLEDAVRHHESVLIHTRSQAEADHYTLSQIIAWHHASGNGIWVADDRNDEERKGVDDE